jgi:hypothetical protein
MSMLPHSRLNFGYFDRQMDLFPDWVHLFNNDWRMANYTDSRLRFGRLLEKVRREMERMDVQPINMDLRNPFITGKLIHRFLYFFFVHINRSIFFLSRGLTQWKRYNIVQCMFIEVTVW